ncbi:hypothetical protein [Actinomadura sp. WMMB 499]|uniref:MinD/ParA family ATP-binding protein n=1 Tax=Actinomadura sp. WMMB 499 TaxID=1219491 RepID=UPI00159E038D|nr:hypothetical protein [Actinomadura sp. WMMB 499]
MSDTTPDDRQDVSGRRAPHGDRATRRLGRTVRRAVGAAASERAREASRVAAQLGLPVPSCRRIVVTSVQDGTGKSTVAALLAAIVQQHRDDRVVAIDADPGVGSLPRRLGVVGRASIRHLAAARPGSWNELSGHLARTPDGLFVVPASPENTPGGVEHETFQRGAGRLSRYFSAAIIDSGAGLGTSLHRNILTGAHAQVIVASATVHGAHSARAALQWLGDNGFGHLLPRTVLALVAQKSKADLRQAMVMLSSCATPVTHIPHDRHLAADGPLSLDRVGSPAHAATVEIACTSFARSLDAT